MKCIMQDSVEDWYLESAKMASIYMNAVLTIAAVDTIDIDAGPSCFRDCIQDEDQLRDRMSTLGDPTPEDIYIALALSGNFVHRPSGEWDTRGWTFQEKMLSRRIISITTEGIYWDCLHHSASDQRPTGIKGDFSPDFRDTDDRAFKRLVLAHDPGLPLIAPQPQAVIYWQWRRAVQDYTTRDLTHHTDRPFAMGGINLRFSSILGDVVAYGIWQNDAIRSLIWFRDIESKNSKLNKPAWMAGKGKCVPTGSPSWSWYGVTGHVQYRLWHPWAPYRVDQIEEFATIAEVKELPIEPMNRLIVNPTPMITIRGAIRMSWLFKGRLYVRVQNSESESSPSITTTDGRMLPVQINENDLNTDDRQSLPTAAELRRSSEQDPDKQDYKSSVFLADNGDPNDDSGSLDEFTSHPQYLEDPIPKDERVPQVYSLYCLLMGQGGYTQDLSAHFYLVLSPITSPETPNTFHRIGVCVFERRLICKSLDPHTLQPKGQEPACQCVKTIQEVMII